MRLQRSHTCGELRSHHAGQPVVLNGWVDAIRDHGGLIFVELRDRYGHTQTVVDPAKFPAVSELKPEYVVAVRGVVRARPAANRNAAKATGEIEVITQEFEILNRCKVPPFEVVEELETREELRLAYRYVDMRRRRVLHAMEFRSELTQLVRKVFHEHRFVEVETPILMKTSPEGARDYIVPTRYRPGWVYALPQSPQLFKQTLMVAGLDRYFQICKCFRDEDLRADRQPEFTQIDLEMSFVRQADVFRIVEEVMTTAYREMLEIEVPAPFPRMTFVEAMRRYGSDKPDTRFALELFDLSDACAGSAFQVFRNALALPGGAVRALSVPSGGALTRKQIEQCEAVAREYGAKGMPWVKLVDGAATGGIAKFLSAAELAAVRGRGGAADGDLVIFGADQYDTASKALGQVRLHLGRELGLIDPKRLDMLWITDFPLFEYHPEEKRWQAMHHMFTAPREELPEKGEDLSQIHADLYDLVLNGNELGSGSIRIHRPEVQRKVFDLVGITPEEAEQKFGWFLRALDYGAPPHGGIALGLDRIVMLMLGATSLRDVIAFPKTASGGCPLTESPSPAAPEQLRDVGLIVAPEKGH